MTKNIQGISVRTHLKAGGLSANHNERLVREAAGRGLRVRTQLKAGGTLNHNEALVREAAGRGLRVRTQLKAGGGGLQNNEALVRDRRERRR